jgi:hypothetical protein
MRLKFAIFICIIGSAISTGWLIADVAHRLGKERPVPSASAQLRLPEHPEQPNTVGRAFFRATKSVAALLRGRDGAVYDPSLMSQIWNP